ncbi:MAG: glycosyltransferase [Saprospiraceae bacterium]|nr:glycosyltransferase [Candidatus Vicinibacter proximus]MBL7824631.1 glycosyltransferase [Saprospiraceae bacterium]MCC6844047.1 glycosyltransferase [Saprospiraceae bacterium]
MLIFFISVAFLTFIYLILCFVFLVYWRNQKEFNLDPSFVPTTKVSVIVPVRNEEDSLQQCTESILKQNYPTHLFELIVVDDQSDDNTPQILENIKDQRLRVMRLGVYKRTTITGSKKKAIAYGISHASGDLMITTDADCIHGENWIQTIVACYQEFKPKLIVAPVLIQKEKTLLNLFQDADFINSFMVHLAGIRSGLFYLGSGANLAYEKSVFLETDPYANNQYIASGDDLFLIQKVKEKYSGKIYPLKAIEATVQTIGATSVRSFFSQRLRWAGKLKNSSSFNMLLVSSFIWVFRIGLLTFTLITLVLEEYTYFYSVLGLLFIHFLLDFILIHQSSSFFKRGYILKWILPIEVMYTIYFFVLGLLSWLPIKLEWKDRKI